jgi:hypothetical protein
VHIGDDYQFFRAHKVLYGSRPKYQARLGLSAHYKRAAFM